MNEVLTLINGSGSKSNLFPSVTLIYLLQIDRNNLKYFIQILICHLRK